MPLTPMSQEELDKIKVLPEGVYDFEVYKAEETTSKKGSEMVAVVLRVFGPNGNAVLVNDWLVGSDAFMCQHKIRTFCDTCGIDMVDEATATNACGKVVLEIQDDPQYGRQNRVKGYYTGDGSELGQERKAKPQGVPASQTAAANASLPEDEIPF